MLTHPRRFPGVAVGVGLTLAALAVAGYALFRFFTDDVTFGSFGWGIAALALLLLALSAGFRTWCLASMAYLVFEGKVLIRWGPRTHVIPVQQVTRAVAPSEAGVPFRMRRWWWPGHYRQDGRVVGIGETRFYCTSTDPARILLLATPYESYAITPPDPAGFRAAIDAQRQSPLVAQQETRYWWPARLPLWTDRPIQILSLVCLAIAALTFGLVLLRFPGIPERIAIRFNAFGQAVGVVDRVDVFEVVWGALAAAAFSASVGLVVHGRDRLAAYLAVAGGIFVQVLFFIAAARIVL